MASSAWEPVFRPAQPPSEPLAHACTWDPTDFAGGSSKKWWWGRRRGGGGGEAARAAAGPATPTHTHTLHQEAAEAEYLRCLVQDQAAHLAALAADRERAAAEAAAATDRAAYLAVRHELLVDMWTLRVLDNEALGGQQQQQAPPPPPPQQQPQSYYSHCQPARSAAHGQAWWG